MKTGSSIDVGEISTVLARKVIVGGHITSFEIDGADPVMSTVDPTVHKQVATWMESELNKLLGKAA
jgi:hypothetical protein